MGNRVLVSGVGELTLIDPRLSEIRNFWLDTYNAKYQITYLWTHKKDDALLQRALKWADTSFGPEATINKLKEAIRGYLDDSSEYVTTGKHPFGLFATNPHKWLPTPKLIPATQSAIEHCETCQDQGRFYFKDQVYRCQCKHGEKFHMTLIEVSDEGMKPPVIDDLAVCLWIGSNPERMIRGFKQTYKQMQARCPQLYEKIVRLLPDTIGRERATKMWRDAGKVDNFKIKGMVKA